MNPGEFWDRESAKGSRSWMESPAARCYINEQVTGDPHIWPLDWLGEVLEGRMIRRALSVGCGTGSFERDLIRRGLCSRVDAFDLSVTSLAAARRMTRSEGVEGIRYFAADFNRLALPRRRYDGVFFHQSLHHVGKLEKLLRQMLRALTEDGIVFLDEFVGPSRHDWTEGRVARYQPLYERVPPEARWFDYMPFPVQWQDLSEAVRSADILPRLRIGFHIEHFRPYGGNVLAVLYPALVHRKITDEMIEWMIEEDRAAQATQATGEPSFHAVVIARPRTGLRRFLASVRYAVVPKVERVGREIFGALGRRRRRMTRPRRLLHPPEYDDPRASRSGPGTARGRLGPASPPPVSSGG